MSDEAFVYLWFDAKNRMFYLGSHKGHPEDNYTHSSSIMEAFNKRDTPVYMRRRILATGTYESMRQLENDLLNNRKACLRRWDKYYNVIASFPPPPMYGEKNPSYIHGKSKNREHHKEYYQENREKIREGHRKYYQENREKLLEAARKYDEENREKVLERRRKYNQENREKRREYNKEYYQENREKIREGHRKYYQENREKLLEAERKYRAIKKAEKMGTSTLEDFLNEA